jgi:hypothetical protein
MSKGSSKNRAIPIYAHYHWGVNKGGEICVKNVKDEATPFSNLGKFKDLSYCQAGKLVDDQTGKNMKKSLLQVLLCKTNLWYTLQYDFLAKKPSVLDEGMVFHKCMASLTVGLNEGSAKLKNAAGWFNSRCF